MTAMMMMHHHHDDPQLFQTIDIPPSHSIQKAKNPLTSRWIQLVPWANEQPNRHRSTRTSTTTTTTTPTTTTKAAATSSVWQSFVEQGGWMVHRGDIVRLWQPPTLLPLRDEPVPTTPTTNHSSSLPQWYILEPTLVEPPPLSPSPPRNQTGILDHATMLPPNTGSGSSIPDFHSLPHARDLLWLYKPDGLLTLPGKTEPDCLATQVNQFLSQQRQLSVNGTRRNNQYNNNNNKPMGNQKPPWIPRPCHRLDRDTSGIIVMAKTKDAYTALSKQFEQRYVKKQYVALVHGWIKQDSGMIDQPIGEKKKKQPRQQQQHDGGGDSYKVWTTDPDADKLRPAITYYQVSRRYRPTTLTENGPHDDGSNQPSDELDDTTTSSTSSYSRMVLQPQTGRGHQLRLHMAKVLGCPILGDTLHDSVVGGGGGVAHKGRDPGHDNHCPSSPRIVAPRLCLHAEFLQVWVLDEHDRVRQAKCWCLPPF
jgi:23S rRNA-/tRNA-specific pseudouridylate synthase